MAADAAVEIAAAVWDRVLTAATHNIATSAGRRLRALEDVAVLREEEQAQGGSANSLTLNAAASSLDDFYEHAMIVLTGGAGDGQVRTIQSYVGSTRVANVVPDWVTTPDATTKYTILAMTEVHAFEVHETQNLAQDVFADGAVWIDSQNGTDSTTWPTGTIGTPCKTDANALAIAQANGLYKFRFVGAAGTFTLNAAFNAGYEFEAGLQNAVTIDLNGQTVSGVFRKTRLLGNTSLTSYLAGFEDCKLSGVGNFWTPNVIRCQLAGTITPADVTAAVWDDCHTQSAIATDKAVLDLQLSVSYIDLTLSRWSGNLKVINCDVSANDIVIDALPGSEIEIDSTCTAGTITVRGGCKLVNNTGGATVVDERYQDQSQQQFADGAVWVDLTNGIAGTAWPLGTIGNPVNNINDAKTIADANKLKRFTITAETADTITLTQAFAGFDFVGRGHNSPRIDLNGQDVELCHFSRISLKGESTGSMMTAEDCNVEAFPTTFKATAVLRRCHIWGTLKSSGALWLFDCTFPSTEVSAPLGAFVDFTDGVAQFIGQNLRGTLTIQNSTGASSIIFGGDGLEVFLDSSNTDGTFEILPGDTMVHGKGDVISAGATVNDRRNPMRLLRRNEYAAGIRS